MKKIQLSTRIQILAYLGAIGVSLIIGSVVFFCLTVSYFIIVDPPSPERAIIQKELRVSGPIISKDQDYLLIERQRCSSQDCHRLNKEMRFKTESFDSGMNVGEVITLHVDEVSISSSWFQSTVEPAVQYRNVYEHYRIDRGDWIGSVKQATLFKLVIFIISFLSGLGTLHWVIRKQRINDK